ncbi:hypothetical protein JYJ95_14380 [Corallococcus exiguus]|uniref:hypothetical protein n=1 Tax=Corallococcus exiguus TaxID=83462 RepID=UPI001A8F244B|nr:hypothetical protein [Corallococcus exiguus]MBN8467703.1 hypothetical protein [Corallococcus exiguus]
MTKHFLRFSGGIIAVLLLVFVVMFLVGGSGAGGSGGVAMGLAAIFVIGTAVAAGVILLVGAGMLLWSSFTAKDRRVRLGLRAAAAVIVGGMLFAGISYKLEPTYEEKRAAEEARELREALQNRDIQAFTRFVRNKFQRREGDEARSLLAAGHFPDEDYLRQLLAEYDYLPPEQLDHLRELGGRHEDFIATLPYRSRMRYRCYKQFSKGDPLGVDSSGHELWLAYGSFQAMGYREEERQRSPEGAQGVSQAVERLSADSRSLASPLFLLLNEYLMKVYPTSPQHAPSDTEKQERNTALRLLRERGILALNAEEKQDAELQAVLRAAGLAEFLE